MNRPSHKYTREQLKAIAILEKQPMSRDELIKHFPDKDRTQLAAMLRNPMESGKIVFKEGKYAVFSPPPGLKVIKGKPMPYSPPPKLEPIIWESDLCQ